MTNVKITALWAMGKIIFNSSPHFEELFAQARIIILLKTQ